MKIVAAAIALTLLCADGAQAAWLLWKHSWVTRRVEGKPRGLAPEGNVDKWDLLNALELRQECVAALRTEHKKSYDTLTAVYPNEPVSQSMVAAGIGATLSTGAEIGGARTTQLYYEYTFWCLPAGVDPKITRSTPEKK
ncbi:MAG: hypothetical protein EXR70_17310 [Deltaproteobacteria bacterium]|nr:hypothetical protein [Deltaproteobacteria bacterium]